ncbi:MAG: hypothetical protein LKJ03_04740 [Enterococcaceae bacterium]|jgi:hypothetical protein|nr:hypothetical protein [Enterococcaceae bacterium]MCI1919879.1 hypothetical protein [Enterococcaceae bacterium]
MKRSIVITATTALGLLGVLALGTTVHATEVPSESKDTNTQVKIIDSPDPDPAVLKLVHVPEEYNFETKLNADGNYQIDGGVAKDDRNITVFNDKAAQDWSVKASLASDLLLTDSGKKATVTEFKINGQSLMGQSANQIVHKAEATKTIANNTGNISKAITDEGLSVTFNNEKHDLKAGDILTGTIHYQLYNTPDAK